jgi:hypothetical protein
MAIRGNQSCSSILRHHDLSSSKDRPLGPGMGNRESRYLHVVFRTVSAKASEFFSTTFLYEKILLYGRGPDRTNLWCLVYTIVATRKLKEISDKFMPRCRFMDDVEFTAGDQESFQPSSI